MKWDTELEKIGAKTKYPIGDGDHGYIKPEMYQKNGVPYIRVGDITWSGSIDRSKMVYISEEINNANPKSFLYPGDIVISKTGATIGKVAVIPDDMPISNTTSSIGKISLDKSKANSKYVVWCMRSQNFQTQMWRVSHKSAQPGFNIQDLKKFKIPLPPLATQQKIAAILDAADELRQKDKALVAKYDELTQALFLDMFGAGIGENIELGKIIKLIGGGTPSKMIEEYWKGTIPWASVKDLKSDILKSTIDHITEEAVKNSATNIIPAGSLIIATRMAVGKAVICEQDTAINQDLKAVKIIGDANVKFLQHFFKSKETYFDSISSGATVKGIKIEHITKLKVPIPPIKLQNQFAERVKSIEEQKSIAQASAIKSEDLFNSLLQKAFNGDLV